MYDLLQSIFVSASLYTALLFPRYFVTNIMLLPLYRSLPFYGGSRRAASAVLNLGSSGEAVISCRLNKE